MTKNIITHNHMNLSQNYMGVSENNGTPKSSILIGFSIINHPFWDIPIFGNTHMYNNFGKKTRQDFFGGVIHIAQATCGSAETWGKFGPGWIAVDWIVIKTRHFLEKAIGWPWDTMGMCTTYLSCLVTSFWRWICSFNMLFHTDTNQRTANHWLRGH